jgi:hypothetical protein
VIRLVTTIISMLQLERERLGIFGRSPALVWSMRTWQCARFFYMRRKFET